MIKYYTININSYNLFIYIFCDKELINASMIAKC